MSRHTPGPWKVDPKHDEHVITEDSLTVASMDIFRPDALANARLIAAAPELLEAARAILQCREDGTFGPDGQQGFKMLAEAVAKAGGQP